MPCVFNDKWLLDSAYKDWLRRVPNDNHSAACLFCGNKPIKIGAMGESALKSHLQGNRHTTNAKKCGGKVKPQLTLNIISPNSSSSPNTLPSGAPSSSSGSSSREVVPVSSLGSTVSNFVTRDEVLDAEIIWTLPTIKNYHS